MSHYGRGKSKRIYLPPELNVVRMWRDWKKDRASKNCSISSLSKFKKHFYRDFNIGFGNPRSDVCSYCETKKKHDKANHKPHHKGSGAHTISPSQTTSKEVLFNHGGKR